MLTDGQSMQMGVIGMHMANEGLTSHTFKKFEHEHLVELFSIDTQVSVESGIPGVTMTQPVRLASVSWDSAKLNSFLCMFCAMAHDTQSIRAHGQPPSYHRRRCSGIFCHALLGWQGHHLREVGRVFKKMCLKAVEKHHDATPAGSCEHIRLLRRPSVHVSIPRAPCCRMYLKGELCAHTCTSLAFPSS